MRFTSLIYALALSASVIGSASAQALSETALPDTAQLELHVEIPRLDVPQYARPYVAVWIEDQNRQTVANLALWTGNQTDWLKDIRRWWRQFGRYNSQNVDGYSSATRTVGTHQILWDGTDLNGERLPQGQYTLFVEAVREHGGRDLIRQKLTLSEDEIELSHAPKGELGTITLHYQL